MEQEKHGRFRAAIHSILAFASGSGEWSGEDPAGLATQMTTDDLGMALADALAHAFKGSYPSPRIVDIEEGFVIYRQGYDQDACCYRQAYTVDAAGTVTLTGACEEVQRNTQYIPVVGNAAHQPGEHFSRPQEDRTMLQKADVVKALIAHQQTIWVETDTPLLTALSDEQLARLMAEAATRPGTPLQATATDAAAQASGTAGMSIAVVQGQAGPVTLDAIQALLATALDARDAALEGRLTALSQAAQQQAERAQLLARLMTHGWTEQDCEGMSLDALRKIVQTVAPVTYAGMGFPAFGGPQTDDAELPDDAPKWD
jgi:hypothetical protein